MSRRQAGPARALVRGFVLFFAAGLSLVSGCGRQTFDLLPGAGAGAPGGGSDSIGAGGGSPASGGTHSGGGESGEASGGRGGGPTRSNGGGGNGTAGFAGSSSGGNDGTCLPGDACVDGGVRCPPDSTGACRRCTGDDDCAHDAPYCDPIDGRCVECFPGKDECPDGETCDATLLRCAKVCASPADCNRYCSRAHICVDCQQNADCREGMGQAKYSCFYGVCVECQTDADCIDPSKPQCQALKCVARQ